MFCAFNLLPIVMSFLFLYPWQPEQLQYEIGLQINNQENLTELEQFTMKLYKLTDTGILNVVTQSAILTSVQESFLYQQRIYGYTKEAEKQTASSVGTVIIIGVILLLVFIALCLTLSLSLRARITSSKLTHT
jgi:uncharacterized membrane protein